MSRSNGINLILETDAIVHPLTGIGRYVFELLQAFQSSGEFSDLRCISRGRWYQPDTVIEEGLSLVQRNGGGASNTGIPALKSNPARALMRRLVPHLNRRSLGKLAGTHIYHSPNYKLSPFQGKKIATFHDLSLFLFPQHHPADRLRVLRPAIEQAAHDADHLITDSLQVRQEVMSYFGVPGEEITAIPLAASLSEHTIDEHARNEYLQGMGLEPGKYLLFVSTLEPRKNISGLLGAYDLLPASTRRHFPLVLAGQLGWNTGEIESGLRRARRYGKVIQTGYLSNRDICHLYSGARAFVYPSLYEGFGLPVIEAQGFGLPVITSDCSCLPEVAGKGAILVNPESFGALATAMQQLIEDDRLHDELVRSGKKNASRFNWSETARKTTAIYRKLSDAG